VGGFYLGPKMGMDFMGFDLDDILGFVVLGFMEMIGLL
jgi:hypothetical protein